MSIKLKMVGLLAVAGVLAHGGCGGDSGSAAIDAGSEDDAGKRDSGGDEEDAGAGDSSSDKEDAGTKDAAGEEEDGGGDAGGSADCFSGAPSKMEDFLNACTDVDTASKPTLGIPDDLLNADGTVKPIPNAAQ